MMVGGGGARPALQRYSFDSFYTYTHTWYPSPLLLKGQTSEIEMGQKRGLNIGWRPSKTWYGWRLQKGWWLISTVQNKIFKTNKIPQKISFELNYWSIYLLFFYHTIGFQPKKMFAKNWQFVVTHNSCVFM